MSISDFSLSSPRKNERKYGDKSITYDEEFEKFLNDVEYFLFGFVLFKISFLF